MRLARTIAPLCLLLLTGIGQCDGTPIIDNLSINLPPPQAEACRQAVDAELSRQGVKQDRIRMIHYQPVFTNLRLSSARIVGFEGWVYPKESNGSLIIELSEACQVTRVWERGLD